MNYNLMSVFFGQRQITCGAGSGGGTERFTAGSQREEQRGLLLGQWDGTESYCWVTEVEQRWFLLGHREEAEMIFNGDHSCGSLNSSGLLVKFSVPSGTN